MTAAQLTITTVEGLPRVTPGDDLGRVLGDALDAMQLRPQGSDILVVTQKIVSKAEDRYVDLDSLTPSARARELAALTGKDPQLVEAILSETAEIVRAQRNVLIVETRHGLVMANAGIDQSNLEGDAGRRRALRLPANPDRSAAFLKGELDARFGCNIGVIISDSVGRAWRLGTVGLAIGAAGIPSLLDRRGELDLAGRRLEVTEVGIADAVAAAAVLVMGEAAEGRPAALVRGLTWSASAAPAEALLRPKAMDLFR